MFKLFYFPFKLIGLPIKMVMFLYKMTIIALVIFVMTFAFQSKAHAACVGSTHILLTPGSTEECIERKKAKLEAKRQKKEEKQYRNGNSSFMAEMRALTNTVTGEKHDYVKRIGYDKLHALQIDWGMYFLPTEIGYSKQGPSHLAPSALTYYYFVNPSFSIGAKYQAYTLYAGVFDGGLGSDTLDVMRFWGHITFHFDISDGYQFYTQVGVPLLDSSKVYLSGAAKDDPIGNEQFMFEAGLSYFIGSNKVTAGVRFTDAPNGSSDFNTYHNLGSTEMFVGLTIGLF